MIIGNIRVLYLWALFPNAKIKQKKGKIHVMIYNPKQARVFDIKKLGKSNFYEQK